jgi:tetratricopeptide (TPR) repeat protein
LAGIFYHNAVDIQSLAALFLYINQMAGSPAEPSKMPVVDLFSMAVQMEATGEIDGAVALYERLLSEDLPEVYSVELHLRYAHVLKKSGQFDHAAQILDSGSELNNLHMMIQLAKVLEHQQRDYRKALEWTEKALDLLKTSRHELSEPTIKLHETELAKRKARLLLKVEKDSTQ